MLYDINNIILIITFIIDVALAGYLVFHDRRSAVNISFAAVTVSLAVWGISYVFWSMAVNPAWVKFWIDMTFFTTSLMPAFFLYFSIVFPKREYVYSRGIPAVFLPAVVFGLASFTTLLAEGVSPPYVEPAHGQWYLLFVSYLIAYLGYSFYIIISKYMRAAGRERIQIQYMMLGTLITAVIGVFTNVFLVTKGVSNFGPLMVNAIGPASTLVMAGFVTYAIVRYRLLGIEYIFSRVFSYLVVFSFICVAVMAFATNTVRDIIYTYTILANLSLGMFVLINAPKKRINLTFLLFAFVVASWTAAVMMFRISGDIVWGRIVYALASFIPPVFISFVRVFPRELKGKEEYSHAVIYVFSILFFILALNGLIVESVADLKSGPVLVSGPYYSLMYMYFAASIGLGFFELYFNYRNAKGISRMQVKYLYLGTFLATAGGAVTGIVLPVLGYPEFTVIGPPCFLIMLAFLAYAILKHRLMSIEVIIQKSLIYTALTAMVLVIYFLSEYVLREAIGYSSIVSTVFTASLMAMAYNPVLHRLEGFTDAVFFKEKYDYRRILAETGKQVSAVLKIEELVKLVSLTFVRTMRISEVSFLLADRGRGRFRTVSVNLGEFQPVYKKLEISEGNAIIRWLRTSGKILVKDELEAEYEETGLFGRKEIEELNAELEKLEFALWLPITLKGELEALICLGYKLSGDMYTDEDIELLYMLENQLAISLDNSLMYSTIARQYEELKETKDRLVRADKMAALGNMAAGMAHEIKNPLSSMKVFSQLLHDRYPDPEFRAKFEEVIPKEINRIDRIVEGLISFAKSPEPHLEEIKLSALLDDVLDDLASEIERTGVKVEKRYSALPDILADREQLSRAFSNVVLNAVQSLSENGSVTIETSVNDRPGFMRVAVSDNGCGISQEGLKHVFDPFFTTKHYGSGLGLAVTHSIIEGHGGTIEITSEEGRGTKVTVVLPQNPKVV